MIFLGIEAPNLFSSGGLVLIAIPIIQVLFGLVPNIFKSWFISKNEFSKRSHYLVEKLIEELATRQEEIISKALTSDNDLRGEGIGKPDLLVAYHEKMFLYSLTIGKLNQNKKWYKRLNRTLLVVTITAVLLSFCLFIKGITLYAIITAITLIFIEIIIIIFMFVKNEYLENCEEAHKIK